MAALLAFDTSGERFAVAAGRAGRIETEHGDGGAKASALLLPAIERVLAAAGLAYDDLDAIAFGRGPGAFTGIRTACAVAQGLALGAGKPVLPLDSLLALAEDARQRHGATRVWSAVDARMGEVYAAEYAHDGERWRTVTAPLLTGVDAFAARLAEAAPVCVAGDALLAFAERLPTGAARRVDDARPTAAALIALAAEAWRDGAAVDAALALPLYVRDKVALTSAERAAAATARAGGERP